MIDLSVFLINKYAKFSSYITCKYKWQKNVSFNLKAYRNPFF